MECHPGVEIRDGDDLNRLTHFIQGAARTALFVCPENHEEVSRFVEDYIRTAYPGRAYFIETEKEGRGVQIYQPYGMPRKHGADQLPHRERIDVPSGPRAEVHPRVESGAEPEWRPEPR